MGTHAEMRWRFPIRSLLAVVKSNDSAIHRPNSHYSDAQQFTSLIQFWMAILCHNEMAAFHFENRGIVVLWLLDFYCPSIPDRQ
jgi:hypothetical protein